MDFKVRGGEVVESNGIILMPSFMKIPSVDSKAIKEGTHGY
jgi:hypothetical protein